jgi:demethylmenaquinone methyltransferase / 2-methoxy-6-polyprenyl-1,4-benzoquinol methylase
MVARSGSSALPSDEEKSAHVRRMFSSIAPRYDLLNHLLSLNIDKRWRRQAVDLLDPAVAPAGRYLDNCSGTLDLAVELATRPGFTGTLVASDFALPMLLGGEGKRKSRPIDAICADALSLPYRDGSFDGATVGFGVRNLADVSAGLREMARVLKPGGRLVVLEFTTPAWQPFRALYFFYFLHVLPLIGRLISSHGSAYRYLPESVLRFPEPPELARMMGEAGFEAVSWKRLTGGIVALHAGIRR